MFSLRILGAFVVTFCLMGTIMASESSKQLTASCNKKIGGVPANVLVCRNGNTCMLRGLSSDSLCTSFPPFPSLITSADINCYYDIPKNRVSCYANDAKECCIHRADVSPLTSKMCGPFTA
ncbi:hypothetical protein PSHT_14594 [Puccinia striiformis]|uniref:Uncharacterized protein n=1 Tax=Puccinia striiformis TaxID=27350 RepID=A0A2S4UJA9_9BASI|nr:hypothetical protein PSHT_14594 [Puccinia striiformis]